MNSSQKTNVGHTAKMLVVAAAKLVAAAIAFACKIVGLVITKIGELFEKLASNGKH